MKNGTLALIWYLQTHQHWGGCGTYQPTGEVWHKLMQPGRVGRGTAMREGCHRPAGCGENEVATINWVWGGGTKTNRLVVSHQMKLRASFSFKNLVTRGTLGYF